MTFFFEFALGHPANYQAYASFLLIFYELFHFRLHAQALTLAALAGAAVVEYYDHRAEAKRAKNSEQ